LSGGGGQFTRVYDAAHCLVGVLGASVPPSGNMVYWRLQRVTMLIVDFSYFCHCAANRRTAIRGVYGARTVRRVVISFQLVIFSATFPGSFTAPRARS